MFPKIDITYSHRQIRMRSREHSGGTIHTKYGLDEWMVDSFGLANAKSQLLRVMNCPL